MLNSRMDSGDVSVQFRTRRLRLDSSKLRHYDVNGVTERTLDINGVLSVVSQHHDYEGGVNCTICGKLYKSRVCFVKHLWEHTIYWEQFPGDKNQDRVLSIQAALILCLPNIVTSPVQKYETIIDKLFVTSPNEKKEQEPEVHIGLTPDKIGRYSNAHKSSPNKSNNLKLRRTPVKTAKKQSPYDLSPGKTRQSPYDLSPGKTRQSPYDLSPGKTRQKSPYDLSPGKTRRKSGD